jgi:hypothetical protein
MSQKYIIKAVDRSAKGLAHVHTPGRAWPSNQEIVVELLDQDECPMIKADKPGYPDLPSMSQVGRKAWALIEADGRLSKKLFGAPGNLSETDSLKAELFKAKEAHGELVAKLAELETVLTAAREEADYASSLAEENNTLKAKVAELETLLESATKTEEPKAKSKAVK